MITTAIIYNIGRGLCFNVILSLWYDAYGMLVAHPINDNQFSVIGSVMLLMALPQAYRG